MSTNAGSAEHVPMFNGGGNEDDIYKIDSKITSTVRAVSSKRELHSLTLMLFLFTANQYIEETDSYKNYTNDLNKLNDFFTKNYNESNKRYS